MAPDISILLVEDEPVDAMTVQRAIRLRELSVDLEVVESAEEAIETLRAGRDAVTTPDLILADLRLPRLSGLDLMENVKSDDSLRCIPFVMLSTSSQDDEVARAYDLGGAGYFVKPVAFEEYADTVETIVKFWARSR